jgi:hypothetical protein
MLIRGRHLTANVKMHLDRIAATRRIVLKFNFKRFGWHAIILNYSVPTRANESIWDRIIAWGNRIIGIREMRSAIEAYMLYLSGRTHIPYDLHGIDLNISAGIVGQVDKQVLSTL